MTAACQSLSTPVIQDRATAITEDVAYGFKPKVLFAIGADFATLSTTWGNVARAGFGWAPASGRYGVGQQTAVGSGGDEPLGQPGFSGIVDGLFKEAQQDTDIRAPDITVLSFNCPNPLVPEGFTWEKEAAYSAQMVPLLGIAGQGLEVGSGSFNWGTGAGNLAVTGVGFQPQAVLFLWSKNDGYNAPYNFGANSGSSFGFGAAMGAASGESWAHYSYPFAQIFEHDVAAIVANNNTGVAASRMTLVSMDSDGFTVHFSGADSGETSSTPPRLLGWLALRDDGGGFSVGYDTQKTSTGTKATTGAGFQPESVILSHANVAAAGVASAPNFWPNPGPWCVGMSDGTTDASVLNGEILRDGAHGDRRMNASAIQWAVPNQTIVAEATVSSLDSDGFTLNYSTADGTARPFGWIAIKTSGACKCFTPQIYRRL